MISLPTRASPDPIVSITCPAAVEISKMWRIFQIGQDNPISLRALSPPGAPNKLLPRNITFTSFKYPNVSDRQLAFEQKALLLNAQGYNSYAVMNRISPSFNGDEENGHAVCDKDISCRKLLLIDLDRAGPTAGPAADAEISEARGVAGLILDHLESEHGVIPIRVMSGNGVHLYLPLEDVPNDNQAKVFCKGLLQRLAKRFNSEAIKVDTTVFNAARITKVPGTIARKGLQTETRPYRMALVL
jgi:hypothetical protein